MGHTTPKLNEVNQTMPKSNNGFTMLEIILVLATLAILAGVMAPYAVREINASKKDATLREMIEIENGLIGYYHDCGQLPATATGLVALAQNAEGLPNWNGPYVGGSRDIQAGITTDAWGGTYTYEREPTLQGVAATVDYFVVSEGDDRQLDSTSSPTGWTLDYDKDIVLQGVTRAVDDVWETDTRDALSEIAEGLLQYYLDVGGFPTGVDSVALAQLIISGASGWSGPYVGETLTSVSHDPWGSNLLLRPCSEVNGETADGWILLSLGAGRPDAHVVANRWFTGSNDIYRVILRSQFDAMLNLQRRGETLQELKLLAGLIYVNNPTGSPNSYVLGDVDPWASQYRYARHTARSGVVYSFGPNGADNGGGGDDPHEAMLWPPHGGGGIPIVPKKPKPVKLHHGPAAP